MLTKEKINQAGKYFINKDNKLSKDESATIIKEFRLIHQHPMTLFRHTIDRKLIKHNINALVSQRLKRISSIIKKLKLQKNMQLSRMQDVGGLRVVVNTIEEVYKIKADLADVPNHLNSKFTFANEKNYIDNPPDSGYRSIHMIYRYNKNISFEKQCRVEIQIRTKLQHSWATAVEVVGTYLNQPLKQSRGNKEYLDIFKKISKLFIGLEKKEIDYSLVREVKKSIEEKDIQLLQKLNSFNIVSNEFSDRKGQYLLLKMDFKESIIMIQQYSESNFKIANEEYLKMELSNLNNSAIEVVLVSIKDITNLKKSYPNYFMDTKVFIENVTKLFDLALNDTDQQINIDNIINDDLKEVAKHMFEKITKQTLKQLDKGGK